ncbi:MAG: KH domain-containing protein [Thermodesulfobacteriota bacterium]|nr:KH domain-containing protein [Thermodesulfobacteriota bacterium]
MKNLIEYIAKSLVEKPDEIVISEEIAADGHVLVKLAAAQDDMGRIIGKQGRNAKAMRTLLNAKATRENLRAALQILESI